MIHIHPLVPVLVAIGMLVAKAEDIPQEDRPFVEIDEWTVSSSGRDPEGRLWTGYACLRDGDRGLSLEIGPPSRPEESRILDMGCPRRYVVEAWSMEVEGLGQVVCWIEETGCCVGEPVRALGFQSIRGDRMVRVIEDQTNAPTSALRTSAPSSSSIGFLRELAERIDDVLALEPSDREAPDHSLNDAAEE